MLIIGEKINGTLPRVAEAIRNRDGIFIQELARAQVEAASDYLEVNAGTPPDREPDDLAWLVDTVQVVVDVPLSLDSANPAALSAALQRVARTPLINSISGERARLQTVLPLAQAYGCPVIALLLDDEGIPGEVEGRLAVARKLLAATRAAGMSDGSVFIDPLVMAIATNSKGGATALEVMRAVRAQFPEVKLSIGLSNVSFGLPARRLINRAFLVLALGAGVDAAVMDPLDGELQSLRLAAEAVVGLDPHCRAYTTAYRAGRLAPALPNMAG